ncbi:MAG: hypothetical protein AAFQ82_17830, partial [Myxococcota bacterium]
MGSRLRFCAFALFGCIACGDFADSEEGIWLSPELLSQPVQIVGQVVAVSNGEDALLGNYKLIGTG